MPSDFARRQPERRRRTLADLLRQLHSGGPSAVQRAPFSTTPVAGPGRLRNASDRAARNRQSELDKRRQAADEALKRLRGGE